MLAFRRRKQSDQQYDPTKLPPPAYTDQRAKEIYVPAFRRMLEYIAYTQIQGDILEFGTLRGYTARVIATIVDELKYDSGLHLYDSFEGLPDPTNDAVDSSSYEVAVNEVWFKGSMALEEGIDQHIHRAISKIAPRSDVRVIKGFFEDTLEKNLPNRPVSLLHIDCDLYSSTAYVLKTLIDRQLIQDGAVIACDDYNCNRANPKMGERLALEEAFAASPTLSVSRFFSYGWHGCCFFVHQADDHEAQPGTAGRNRVSNLLGEQTTRVHYAKVALDDKDPTG